MIKKKKKKSPEFAESSHLNSGENLFLFFYRLFGLMAIIDKKNYDLFDILVKCFGIFCCER